MRVTAHEANLAAAQTQDIEAWNNQGSRNPHGATHFGEWAMRPLTPMALLEPGVTPYAGSAIRLEAHIWNAARSRPIEDQDSAFDFGPFSVAWALQVVVPLIVFVLAAGLVARERERGALRLLLARRLPARRLVLSKVGSITRIAGLLTLPILVAAITAVILAGPADPARLALWCVADLVYLLIVAAIALAVSALARTGAQAMLVLACLWLVAVVLVPRVGATLPPLRRRCLPPTHSGSPFSRIGIRSRTSSAKEQGGSALTSCVVTACRAVRICRSPSVASSARRTSGSTISSSIVTMAGLRTAMALSLLSLLPAIQNLSMSLAGTSMPDRIDFQRQGEAQRRRMITFFNSDMTRNASAREFDYRAGETLWHQTPRFA